MRTPGIHCTFALAAGLLLVDRPVAAQQGVTLQLPTFSFFSVATTVVVPDRGGAYMAGVGRVGSGSSRFGRPGGGQAFGFERNAAGLHASAHIHDLRGIDEALRHGSEPATAASPLALGLAKGQATSLPSLKEIESQRSMKEQAARSEAADFFQRGRDAQSAGKAGLARTYYQMALRRASGDLRSQIAAQLEQLGAAGARVANDGEQPPRKGIAR
jgi:hypothetical protein